MSQRTITGLSPIQDITCESIDISEVITINGAMPTSTMPLGFDATTGPGMRRVHLVDTYLGVAAGPFHYGR